MLADADAAGDAGRLELAGSGGASAEELTFDLKVERGRVASNMQLIRVKQGDVVRLRWSTDRAHGSASARL